MSNFFIVRKNELTKILIETYGKSQIKIWT